MVKKYLNQLLEEYQDKKIQIEEQIFQNDILLKENIEFIKLLEDTTDNSFECFTPRDINAKNKNKIVQLKEEQKEILNHLSLLKEEQSRWSKKIDELKNVISVLELNNVKRDVSDLADDKDVRLALLEAREKEQQRISRELHDSTIQNLTSLLLKSELCIKLLQDDPIRCKLELVSINHMLRDIIQDTREFIYDLRPMSFDDIGLNVTIEDAIHKIEKANSIHIQYIVEGEEFVVPSVIGISILRMIQEGCSNAIKHGNATMISVKLVYQENLIKLEIVDDGCGFDVNNIPAKSRDDLSGFGLSMMKERVYLLSGELSIVSNESEGTTICASIPITS